MSRRTLRGPVAVALVVAGSVIGPGSPATAAGSAGYCPDASGVTVVVDFNELGGGTVVRCAPGSQATGLAALKNAGFQITGTLRWGEGFICRIGGKPSAAAEKCVDTPPASAYWSYWHAPNGGSWTYSDKGVLNRTPPAGSFEGWSFSLNREPNNAPRPGVTPSRPAPPPPASPPAPPTPPPVTDVPVAPPAAGGSVAPPATGAEQPGAVDGPTHTVGPSTSASTSPSASAGGAPSPATATASAQPSSADEPVLTDAVASREESGVPLGTLAGVLLLAVLTIGGLVAARRRRAADPHD
ncbi:hypothetical protein [Salinispora tropica]|uniref:Uncharacterized protein n=1 Tax=Salinispora tropica (strain ATCC BAA-916 / DSM 44818 / JCM 13857 / NBRC 105044 / CNB-440) TaxID=369723 RepID=A4XD19_SALTO|nr:hypothetical protein [Salinispora tropica]ABP56826.1 hypothetical protein Strop_4398 [Salinispora tropica CNB-440]